ncbi:MAG TPA: RDD family protein [Lacisediminihabitans sp.]|uniref:RDD family protein n=1 Tax=Lacisediminihabitans sp. TaxID=2787631 RepID=UPI002ED8F260
MASPAAAYAAYDESELMTGEAVGLDLRPTGFVLRGAGAAIDVLVSVGLLVLILLAVDSPAFSGLLDDASSAAVGLAGVIFCIVVVPTVVETATRGRSLGRLAVGARIVRDDGGAIGFRQAFIRALVGVLELFLTAGGIAAMVGLLSDRTKRLGDLLAGTYSQNERLPRAANHLFGVPAELSGWAATADVARMPDGLSRRITQFLRQASRLTQEARTRLGAELEAEASRYVSPVPPESPELVLAAIAAIRRDREYAALRRQQDALARLEPVLTGLPHGFPERT